MSVEYDRAVILTQKLKSCRPETPVLWGGIHPTIAPETCFDYADFVCVGEGERFIIDFANEMAARHGQRPGAVRNLACRIDGRTVQNSLYPLISDLSSLPVGEHIPRSSYVLHKKTIFPLDVKAFRKYARYAGTTYSIMSSRGCPFSCTYCCNNALAKIYGSRKIRFRNDASVMAELKAAITLHQFIDCINFQDDCFLSRSEADMEQFCRMYRQEVKIPFVARSIPTFMTDRKLAAMKSAGLAWISLGLQSGSDTVCSEVYNRKSGKQDFLKAARMIKKYDLAAFYDVILDNPFENDNDRLATIRTLMETPKPFYTQYFSLSLYPGTELRERALAEGLTNGDQYRSKDYLSYRKSDMNHLVRLATFIPSAWMEFLLKLYRQDPGSLWFKINLFFGRFFAIFFGEPVTSLKVIHLSQRRKWRMTLRAAPNYFTEGLMRFKKQFGGLWDGRLAEDADIVNRAVQKNISNKLDLPR